MDNGAKWESPQQESLTPIPPLPNEDAGRDGDRKSIFWFRLSDMYFYILSKNSSVNLMRNIAYHHSFVVMQSQSCGSSFDHVTMRLDRFYFLSRGWFISYKW